MKGQNVNKFLCFFLLFAGMSNMPENNSTKITLTEDNIAGALLRIKTASISNGFSYRKRSKIKQPEADLVER